MAEREILDSWKEISAYFKRDIRTCQRRERELNFPVHRLDGSPKARVFAYKDEIDIWLEEILSHKKDQKNKRALVFPAGNPFLFAALILAVVVVALVLILTLSPRSGPKIRFSTKPSLLIFPLKNNTGEDYFEFWSDGLSDSLIADLSPSKYITVLTSDQLLSALQRENLQGIETLTSEQLKKSPKTADPVISSRETISTPVTGSGFMSP